MSAGCWKLKRQGVRLTNKNRRPTLGAEVFKLRYV